MSVEYTELRNKHLRWAEGYSETAYPDSRGIPTIGIGHNLRAKPLTGRYLAYYRQNNRLSRELIYELLGEDVAIAETDAEKLFPGIWTLSVARQVALVDLVFNMGFTKLNSQFQPTIAHINAQEWEDVAQHLEGTLWYKQVGKRSKRVVSWLRSGVY